jgi:UrcA family protein
MLKFLATAALSATLAAAIVAPAAAQTFDQAPTKVKVVVSGHGLNLSDPADATVFVSRLELAVNQACDDRPTSAPVLTRTRSAGFLSCRAKALDEAMSRVAAPAVKERIAALISRPDTQLARR